MSNQKIHLITGKGGVGKSSIAAALAIKLSKSKKKTLLVELGDRGFYSHAWQQEFDFEPRSVAESLWLARWSGEDCLREYIGHLIKVKKLVEIIFDNKIMKALVRAAPALNELSILGKMTSGLRGVGPRFDYDHVVIDAYATGHFKALVNAPRGMGIAIQKGPMGEQSRAMHELLKNVERIKIYIVSLPEELPVNESIELANYLEKEFQQKPRFLLNKCLQPGIDLESLKQFLKRNSNESAGKFPLVEHLATHIEQQQKFYQVFKLRSQKVEKIDHLWIPTSVDLYKHLAEDLPEEFYD